MVDNDERRKSESSGERLHGVMRGCRRVLFTALFLLAMYAVSTILVGVCSYVDRHGDKERISNLTFAITQAGATIGMVITVVMIIGLITVIFAVRRLKLHPEEIEKGLYGVVFRALGDYFGRSERLEQKTKVESAVDPADQNIAVVEATGKSAVFGQVVATSVVVVSGPLAESAFQTLAAENQTNEPETLVVEPAAKTSEQMIGPMPEISERSTPAGVEEKTLSKITEDHAQEEKEPSGAEENEGEATAMEEGQQKVSEDDLVSGRESGSESKDMTELGSDLEGHKDPKDVATGKQLRGIYGFLQKILAKFSIRLELQYEEDSDEETWAKMLARKDEAIRSDLVFYEPSTDGASKQAMAEIDVIDLEDDDLPDATEENLTEDDSANLEEPIGPDSSDGGQKAEPALSSEESSNNQVQSGRTEEIAHQVEEALAKNMQQLQNPINTIIDDCERGIGQEITDCVEEPKSAAILQDHDLRTSQHPRKSVSTIAEALEDEGFDSYYDGEASEDIEQLLVSARNLGLDVEKINALLGEESTASTPIVSINNSKTDLEAACETDGAMLVYMQGVPMITYPAYTSFKLDAVLKMDDPKHRFFALAQNLGLLSAELQDALNSVNMRIEDVESAADIRKLWGVVCFSIDGCGLRGDANPLACIGKERQDAVCAFLAQDIASNLTPQQAEGAAQATGVIPKAVGQTSSGNRTSNSGGTGKVVKQFPYSKPSRSIGGTTGSLWQARQRMQVTSNNR